ncbi:major facilitator superfamily domain-containing protein [Circinella umbellata]|nr:major facilitator superfamily domain-containing protein [Circinella umbellata]
MVIFGLASLGSALVNNIWGLVILRCVQASGASCGQSVGAGVIADCYPIERRGAAFGKYFFGVFFGPVLGPILGGFLIMSNLTWRTVFWFCLAFSCTVLVLILFTFPETYRDNEKWDTFSQTAAMDVSNSEKPKSNSDQYSDLVIQIPMEKDQYVRPSQSQSSAITTPKSNGDGKKKTFNPIKPFQYFRHTHVLLASLIMAFVFGSMFVVETILPILFKRIYGFSSWQIGLSYLGGGVGNFFGAVINTFLSDYLLLHARSKRGGRASVEDRIGINVWLSLFVFMPFGLLLFGWSLEDKEMSFWAGIVGYGLVNFAMNQTVTSLSAYLVDSAPSIGASFTACANFARMIMACILTIVSNPLVDIIGPGLTCVFLTGLIVIAMILLIILKIFGGQFRFWSGYQQKNELKQHL